jgi:hypothetical protein
MFMLISVWRSDGSGSAVMLDDNGKIEAQFIDPVPRSVKGHLLPPPAVAEDLWRTVERAARWAAQEAEKP